MQNGDPEAAFNTIVNQAAAATTALLNSALDPQFGLPRDHKAYVKQSPKRSRHQLRSFHRGGQGTQRCGQSFTLTAPVEKAPASTAGTSSADENAGSGAVSTANTGTVDLPRGLKPVQQRKPQGRQPVRAGRDRYEGWQASCRHRREASVKSLRDAAEKTIKGLTSLGRGGKSESAGAGASSTSAESGSSTSGSSGSARRQQRKRSPNPPSTAQRSAPFPPGRGPICCGTPIAVLWPTGRRRRRCPPAPHQSG